MWANQLKYSKEIERGERILGQLKSRCIALCKNVFLLIKSEVGNRFVISGSWPSKIIADTFNVELFGTMHAGWEGLTLISNDIDVYKGSFGDGKLNVNAKDCQYKKVDGLMYDLNIIPCSNISAQKLFDGNDINVTHVTFDVTIHSTEDIELDVLVGPMFWEVYFSNIDQREIKHINGNH